PVWSSAPSTLCLGVWRGGGSACRSGPDGGRVGETANLGQARLKLRPERGEVGGDLATSVLQRFRRREVSELLEDLYDPGIARRGGGVRRSARHAHDRLVEIEDCALKRVTRGHEIGAIAIEQLRQGLTSLAGPAGHGDRRLYHVGDVPRAVHDHLRPVADPGAQRLRVQAHNVHEQVVESASGYLHHARPPPTDPLMLKAAERRSRPVARYHGIVAGAKRAAREDKPSRAAGASIHRTSPLSAPGWPA